MAFSLGSLSAPAQDFFSQFQPYEQGGITGQPAVDPGQLQPQAPMATTMPMTPPPANPFSKPIGDGSTYNPIGGPGDANNTTYMWNHPELWTMPWQGPRPSEPTIDPSRYDPSKTFEDYYRDYHSPDRDAVLRDYPGMAKRYLMGGSVGRLGSLSSTLPSQGQQGVLNALMHRVMAPDGRMVQVPDHQLADVLQQGGRKVGGF